MQGTVIATYRGKQCCGFMPEHIYRITVQSNERNTELEADYDYTESENIDLYIIYSNDNSLLKNWLFEEDMVED